MNTQPQTIQKARQLYQEAEQLYINGLAPYRQVMTAQRRLNYLALLSREQSPFERQAVMA